MTGKRAKKITSVLVEGNFNVLHPGHIRLFRYAKELGERLIVAVRGDASRTPGIFIPERHRLEGVQLNSYVDEAFILDGRIEDYIRKSKPDIVLRGKEHEQEASRLSEIVAEYGGKLIFDSGDATISTPEFDRYMQALDINNSDSTAVREYCKRQGLDPSNNKNIISGFRKLKVLVIGDVIVDEYINCDPVGLSQEDPTIVVTPIESEKFVGGAAIVAAHAASVGAEVYLYSVVGSDYSGKFLAERMRDLGVQANIIRDETRPTTTKRRYRCKSKTLLRVSRFHSNSLSQSVQRKLLDKMKKMIKKADLIIFSDFNYGVCTDNVIQCVINSVESSKAAIVADCQSSSQYGDVSKYKGVDILFPTEREARIAVRDFECGVAVLAEKLRAATNTRNLIIKFAEEGLMIYAGQPALSDNQFLDRLPALNKNPVDTAGAGDSLLVACSLSYAVSKNIWLSSLIGTYMASIQVGRLGNCPISSAELSRAIEHFESCQRDDHIGNKECVPL